MDILTKKNLRRMKSAVSAFVAITTIVWLSGVVMILPAKAAIANGSLIRATGNYKVYIVNGVYKRWIQSPDIFKFYKHLGFAVVQDVTPDVANSYTNSWMIRADGDTKVYELNGDGTKHWINMTAEQFIATGHKWDMVYVINTAERDWYVTGPNVEFGGVPTPTPTPTPTPGVGTNAVSLSADTPVAGVVAKSAADVDFTHVNFSAGATAYTISSIIVARGGISTDSDVSSLKLYDGTTQVGSTQALNTITHRATFSSLNLTIPANSVKTIAIKATIGSVGGNSVALGIAQASDITASATLGGTFPVMGNAMSIAGNVSVGTLTASAVATPAAGNINSGSTQQQVASFKFATDSSEGATVQSFKLSEVGTASDSDVSNIVVKYGATTLATIAGFTSGIATVTLSPALSINASSNKTVDVYVDVASGINTSRTVKMEITQNTNVTAIGSNSQGKMTIGGSFPLDGQLQTIAQGTYSFANDASVNPPAQNYVAGTSGRTLAAVKFSAGSVEGIRLTQIKFTSAGSATPTDVNNFTLWNGNTQVSTGSISGTGTGFTVQFGTNTVNAFDVPGLVDVPMSGNVTLVLKGDISSAALAHTIIMNLAAAADVKADGLSSKMDLPASTSTTTASTFTIAASGTLTVSLNASSTAAKTIGKAVQGVNLASIDFIAGTGEDINLGSVTIRAYKDAGQTYATAAASTDITNVKLMNGATQLGSTIAAPSTGISTFSTNLIIPAGTTKTLTVLADVPSTTGAGYLYVANPGSSTLDSDISATGVASGVTMSTTSSPVTLAGSAKSNLMTIANPTLTAAMASTPAASTQVLNSTGVKIGSVLLTAGSAEDVNVSSLKVTFATVSGLTGASSANVDLKNVALYDGATQVGSAIAVITDATPDYANFTGITGLTVAKSSTKQIDVKVDINSGNGTTYYTGIAAAGDVAGSGASSSTSVTSTGTGNSAGMTITNVGTLTAAQSADTPAAANVAVGTTGVTGVDFAHFKFTTQYEPIKISMLKLTRVSGTGADSDFVKVKLYADGGQIGPDGYIASGTGTFTFNFPTGTEYVIPVNSSKIITVKADLNGTSNGVTSADAPNFQITDGTSANITAKGVQSGTTLTSVAGIGSPITGNAMNLYRTIATVSLNTTIFTGANGGTGTVPSATQKVMAIDVMNGGTDDLTITALTLTANHNQGSAIGGAGTHWTLYQSDLSTVVATTANGTVANGASQAFSSFANNTVAAGTTKTFIVVADTTGMTNPKSFFVSLATANFGWTPNGGSQVTTLTKNLPITGPTYTY